MARPKRIFIPGASVHVIQRGNNRGRIYTDVEDFEQFLWLLRAAAPRFETDVHGYGLMDTHYHLLVTPRHERALSRTVKQFAGQYAQYFNRKYDRIGTPYAGRYRGLLITDERRWFNCLRYIELNPVHAQMVASPAHYRWTSYHVHGGGRSCAWLTEHRLYTALGPDTATRQAVYRALVEPI